MVDEIGTKEELALYRLEKAKNTLKAAILMFNEKMYDDAVNRIYYAIFHSIRSVLSLEMIDFKKHSGVISHFQKKYIKSGVFDVRLSKIIVKTFNDRNNSDFEDFYFISEEQVASELEDAKFFINQIEIYLKNKISK